MTLHLHTDDFERHQSHDDDVEYGDLDRDMVLELAAGGDEGAADWLDQNPDDGGARAALAELGVRWEFNPDQPRAGGKWVGQGPTPQQQQQAAHEAYERNWGTQRRAAVADLAHSSRQATDRADARYGRLPRAQRPLQPRADVAAAGQRLSEHGEVGAGIRKGVAAWAGKGPGAVRRDPLRYRHFLSAAHEGTPTDRPLHRGLLVNRAQARHLSNLKRGDVIPTRYAASFTEDPDHADAGHPNARLVLAPGSHALPISALTRRDDAEWVVGRDLAVDHVEHTPHGPVVHVHTVGDARPDRHGMGDIPLTPARMAGMRGGTAEPYIRNGRFTPERQALHDEIIRRALEGVEPSEHPRLVMMGGGPASGKTAMVASGAVRLPDQHVAIDADAIKAQLPEVAAMKAAGDDRWASKSHEESSYLATRLAKAAYETRRNVVLDGTGDSSLRKLSEKISHARSAGFHVEGNYITVHPDVAVERANERAQKTGRVVPESFIRDTHASISRVFPLAADQFDSVRIFDNNGAKGEAPTLIGSSDHPGGFTVHDQDKYDTFLSHGGTSSAPAPRQVHPELNMTRLSRRPPG
jgi:predicted ABC-type ATPase